MPSVGYRAVYPPLYRDTPGLQLTSALHSGTGALMRIYVQSIAPIMFGSPAKA